MDNKMRAITLIFPLLILILSLLAAYLLLIGWRAQIGSDMIIIRVRALSPFLVWGYVISLGALFLLMSRDSKAARIMRWLTAAFLGLWLCLYALDLWEVYPPIYLLTAPIFLGILAFSEKLFARPTISSQENS